MSKLCCFIAQALGFASNDPCHTEGISHGSSQCDTPHLAFEPLSYSATKSDHVKTPLWLDMSKNSLRSNFGSTFIRLAPPLLHKALAFSPSFYLRVLIGILVARGPHWRHWCETACTRSGGQVLCLVCHTCQSPRVVAYACMRSPWTPYAMVRCLLMPAGVSHERRSRPTFPHCSRHKQTALP
jgi:hypothetical protein